MITGVGTGLTLPLDVEPYGPGDCEYNAGARLVKRSVARRGPRFADHLVVDGEFATAPFLHGAITFEDGDDRVELWDAADFDPCEGLKWETVRVMRYRQHKRNGTVVEAYWHTNFSPAELPSRSLYRLAKSP